MEASSVPLRRIEGRFYRAVTVDRLGSVLAPPGPTSAGRYHRPGQPTLYITPEPDWAVIAMGPYLAEDGLARMVVPLDLAEARVIDQHDEAVCAALRIDPEQSGMPWRSALAEGREPPSWQAADMARAAGAGGIIDRSRGIAGGWHVALFRWNALGGPRITLAGPPITTSYAEARGRWASPTGWVSPFKER